jgi:hypothetical protein
MTKTEYDRHWNSDFGPLTSETSPSYDEFRISDRMLEDYLDIFRGFNTRENGLEMPYPHPFFNPIGGEPLLVEKPSIRYILVGEARPRPSQPDYNNCLPYAGDENNSYFYDVRHIQQQQPHLSAARLNWVCPEFLPCPSNKIRTLLCLASKGVLLLDLFPFSISYKSDFRKKLNNAGITSSYWNNPINPYNLQDRISNISTLLDSKWDLTMVAPCLISEYIVNLINGFPTLAINPAGLHPATFRTILPEQTRCAIAQTWRKVAVSNAGFGPTANLINLSF